MTGGFARQNVYPSVPRVEATTISPTSGGLTCLVTEDQYCDELAMEPPVVTLGQRRRAFCWMLVTVPLAGAGVDMFLPSLPAMKRAMQTTDFAVQQTVLIYLGFYALAQIVFGPLVDRWGRRIPSAVGAAVMAGASVVIANSDSIGMVLVMRVIQGTGGAVTVVATRSIVADCYDGYKRARAANWMTIAWACGPALFQTSGLSYEVQAGVEPISIQLTSK